MCFESSVVTTVICATLPVPHIKGFVLGNCFFLWVSVRKITKLQFLPCCRCPSGLNQESEGRIKLKILCKGSPGQSMGGVSSLSFSCKEGLPVPFLDLLV